MAKTVIAIGIGVAIVIAIIAISLFSNSQIISSQTNTSNQNDKIGLVINSPHQSTNLKQLDEIFQTAASSGIGRSNVYIFWNTIEPEKNSFDWSHSDPIMSFNKKNNLKVTLYLSIINGETLGPFPNWIGKPPIQSLDSERVVKVIDAILSRYDIIDTVIFSGDTESQFRYNEQNIPSYIELFNNVYDQIKEKHPNVKIGNSFGLHNVLNKNLEDIVDQLSIGDFVAYSYFPVDSVNEIVKTPEQAQDDLRIAINLAKQKPIGFFEISWSTSDFVGGNEKDQSEFIKKSFEIISENSSQIEFFTWYRLYDKPDDSCILKIQQEVDSSPPTLGLGTSNEFVVERLGHYLCESGLIDQNNENKNGWNELKNQIKMIQ
jgi:hypothetical protein